ncbi:hypothetical protein CKK34_0443 [Yarrowia sp. E02]|nr:hypothetical protein CKK34_0443 [Yarrowia sp. E02]
MNISDDVARLVLEQCSVNESVALSQTNRIFRAVFSHHDALIEQQIQAECPWMEKLDSWSQTALVCAARNRASKGDKWKRISYEWNFPGHRDYMEKKKLGTTVTDVSRQELEEYNGVFEDIQLPIQPCLFFVRNGAIYKQSLGRDYDRIHLNLKDMSLAESPSVLSEPLELEQDLWSGHESNVIVSPVSGLEICAADESIEGFKFIDENDSVLIVALNKQAFYVYKPDAEIVDNKLTFRSKDWKRSAVEYSVPRLVGNTSYVGLVKEFDGDKMCLMEFNPTSALCVRVYNGFLYVHRVIKPMGYLYPVWVNLGEKEPLSTDSLIPEEQSKYTLYRVKPAMKQETKAIGGWVSYADQPVPFFSTAENGRFITVREFRKGGGYRIGDLETGLTYVCTHPYRRRNGKANFVFPSLNKDKTITFFCLSEDWGQCLLDQLYDVNYHSGKEDAPPFDSKSQTEAIRKYYDGVDNEELSDVDSTWGWGSSTYGSDNERTAGISPIYIPGYGYHVGLKPPIRSPSPVFDDYYEDDYDEDDYE